MDHRVKAKVYLLCGVPGSGKSWVASQILDRFYYIPHDIFDGHGLVHLAYEESRKSKKPILIDCPFNERRLRAELEAKGLTVVPVFIVEPPRVIRERYFKRENKMPAQNILTRAETILEKVREWRAHAGTSDQILAYLKAVD